MQEKEHDYDEEHNENESKAYRIVRGCFKGVLYGASALVWILIFYTLFSTRESGILKHMYFSEATRNAAKQNQDLVIWQLHTQEFMSRDGSITLSNIWYCAETGELEIGIKYNQKLTESEEEGDLIRYCLTDQNGNEYPIVHVQTDEIGRYGYARVCFSGIWMDLKLPAYNGNGEAEPVDVPDVTLTLSLYRPSDGKPLSTYISQDRSELVNDARFTIFNQKTAYRTVEYDG